MPSIAQRIRASLPSQQHNINTLRHSPLSEISGALGDLGTLLPLLIALTLTESIALSSTLVFTGVANILTGLCFGIPLPVQPMKAIAAVAIARKFSIEQTASAGLFVSIVIGVASILGVLNWIGRVVPVPVVKGIQVGAGLSLVISAGTTLLQPLGWVYPSAGDNLLLACAGFALLVLTAVTAARRADQRALIPAALIIFVAGLIISALTFRHKRGDPSARFAFWHPAVVHPSGSDWKTGALDAGVGQLPLTTLNSIIAVTYLAADLLPSQPVPTPRAIGVSILVMNAVGCTFGAMPACHGSGGLAGQYRFGARSGSSVILLGLVKLLLGLFVAEDWLIGTLKQFPKSLLGIMVVAAGVELAKVGESVNFGAKDLWEDATEEDGEVGSSNGKRRIELSDQERAERWMVMMVTVAGLLAFKNDAVGFILGLCWHAGTLAPRWLEGRSRIRLAEQ